ncbi:MAG: C25 family peptidase propeptide domain-containing protein, partial [Anaerolineae bacterium]
MSKTRVLKVIFLSLGVVVCMAWFGAGSAAGQQPATEGRMSPAVDENLLLIKSDMESVVLELRTPSYQMGEISVDGVAYHLLTVAGYGQTGDVGHPQLPLKGTLLGIPPAADFTLTVLEVEEEVVSERYNIYPVPQPVFERDLEGDLGYMRLEFAKDESVYSSDRFYPASIAEVGSSGFIRDQRVVELRFFPFQYDPVTGELRHCQRIRVELSFSYPRGRPLLAETWEEEDSFNQVLENSLLNYDSASNWRARSSTTFSGAPASQQAEPSYKVLLDQDGVYQLTYTDLQVAGIGVDNVDPRTFKLDNQGDEAAIYVVGEDDGDFDTEDYILFYGQRMTTIYTDTNVYWLTTGGSSGLRMAERDGTLGAGTLLTSFQTTSYWEEDLYYQSLIPKPATIPSEEEKDHWFGGYVLAFGGPASESFTIVLDNLAVSPSPYSSTVRGSLQGWGEFPAIPDHHTRVYLNGHLLDDAYWDGQVEHQFETDIPQSYL